MVRVPAVDGVKTLPANKGGPLICVNVTGRPELAIAGSAKGAEPARQFAGAKVMNCWALEDEKATWSSQAWSTPVLD
jgi:hypothetical protein